MKSAAAAVRPDGAVVAAVAVAAVVAAAARPDGAQLKDEHHSLSFYVSVEIIVQDRLLERCKNSSTSWKK